MLVISPAISGKKKRLTPTLGRITLSNALSFSKGPNGFQISALLQELMVYAGQMDGYGRCPEIIAKFLTVEVSTTQVWRLTDLYGAQVGKTVDFTSRSHPPLHPQDTLYVEADASMIFMRQPSDWKEVKAGRLFKASDCLHPEGKQGLITHSQYLTHLGGCKVFSGQMEPLIESYTTHQQQMVFITDGAPWLRNWIEDAFPGATSILDFYHFGEHLYQFSEAFFKDKEAGWLWAEQQKELLLESKADTVMANTEALKGAGKRAKQKLLNYLKANHDRMDYKRYKTLGCGLIGSGAIESAHRTVVQKRMKLSGQRWSKKGAGHMLNLRVVYMNERWDKVIELAKTPFANSA
jgi:hypothetical protein